MSLNAFSDQLNCRRVTLFQKAGDCFEVRNT